MRKAHASSLIALIGRSNYLQQQLPTIFQREQSSRIEHNKKEPTDREQDRDVQNGLEANGTVGDDRSNRGKPGKIGFRGRVTPRLDDACAWS